MQDQAGTKGRTFWIFIITWGSTGQHYSIYQFAEQLPESSKGDVYKLKTIKSWYRFAKLSLEEKQIERYEKVITEYQDFADRFPKANCWKMQEIITTWVKTILKQ